MKTERKQPLREIALPSVEVVTLSPEHMPKIPVAVGIAERAISLAGIMEYLNESSKVRGMEKQANNPNSAFRRRYGIGAAAVLKGAKEKRDALSSKFHDGIRTISAVDALEANGHDEDEVYRLRMRMQADINAEFAGNNATATVRNALAKKAVRSAENITGQKIEL
jgi:hypothetical protein